MNREEFCLTLKAAASGSHEALVLLFELFKPMIDRHSMVDGEFDEDLRQYILIHIALNISKFIV